MYKLTNVSLYKVQYTKYIHREQSKSTVKVKIKRKVQLFAQQSYYMYKIHVTENVIMKSFLMLIYID